jgi:hypothetical protein
MKRLKTKGRHTSGGGGTAGAAQAVGEGAERPAEAGDETKAVGKGNGGLAVGPEQIGVAIPGGTLAAGDKEFNHMAAPKWWSTVIWGTTGREVDGRVTGAKVCGSVATKRWARPMRHMAPLTLLDASLIALAC